MNSNVTAWLLVCMVVMGIAVGCSADRDQKAGPDTGKTAEEADMQVRATRLLDRYQAEFDAAWEVWTRTEWEAAVTGKKEAFDAHGVADLALKKLHSDTECYREIGALLEAKDLLDPMDARALQVMELAFRENQLPPDKLESMAMLSAKIGQAFNTFRGELEGKKYSNNELLDMLAEEKYSERREAIWQALKQVGGAVGEDLVALARIRNEGARQQGFENYWDMKVRLQEHDPKTLMATFDELEELTREPFRKMKSKMDGEMARRFGIQPDKMMPWHYNNPFFQAAPPSEAINLDEFYKEKQKEDIAALAIRFFEDIGLPIQDIVGRSDLYEREGKDQHAFCEDMNRKGDVRILVNLRPTAEWMDTMLHENGHAVYDKYLDRSLPFNLRQANHQFTTEGVAMLFGALAKTPSWLVAYADADPVRIKEVSEPILEQRRKEQLIFCRWTLVMLNFEKALYENPDQDLNELWWDYVERFQFLTRPAGRNAPDWAAKPHFTIAPVYYHNYQLGELFAAQLRGTLARMAGHQGPSNTLSFNGRKDFGIFLKKEVFAPGRVKPWPEFVKDATGEPLTARFFADELM